MGIFTQAAKSDLVIENGEQDVTNTNDAVATESLTADATAATAEAEVVNQEAEQAADVEQAQEQVAEQSAEQNEAVAVDQPSPVQELSDNRQYSGAAYTLARNSLTSVDFALQADSVRQSINDVRTVQALSQVAQENNFSAPMVAAFNAIPGFTQLVKDFPSIEKFSVCLEPPTSINAVAGMESFAVAATTTTDTMRQTAKALVASFENSLTDLPTVVTALRTQLNQDLAQLETSDVSEDVLATLPVNTLSDASFNELLSQTSMYLNTVQAFNADHLQSNPELLNEEVAGLEAMIQEVGPTFGLTIDTKGLRVVTRDVAFEPTIGTFDEKNITGPGIALLVSHAGAILDALDVIVQNKDEQVQALNAAADAMPTALASDDVTYGAIDHTVLINSQAVFVNKLITEGVQAVAMVLSAVDSIFNIDTGTAE